ncbi:zinc transporter zupT [Coccidioides immitis RMSCC 2394]|uniref:Zinc transporter zupT n=1 Tax=Coccidioides immitis RMSCC 2394 TaxID=404692 RepID=A0A0J7ATT5_COCIT|nr:zinc transporter zupT [Coccidioides immitis RMSCC 2394]
MGLDNDTRGWVMSCVSGVACVLGSTIICVDIVARNWFGKRNFQISDSDVFLSSSMSLSAGVLLFTSLFSMLPTSKEYLIRAGYSSGMAAFMLIGLFLLGVIVIKIVSGWIHSHIPSHVVACAHTHEEDGKIDNVPRPANGTSVIPDQPATERTPLITASENTSSATTPAHQPVPHAEPTKPHASFIRSILSGPISGLVGVRKAACDNTGPCYGFSQACGQECMTITQHRDQEAAGVPGRPDALRYRSSSGPLPPENSRMPEIVAESVAMQPDVDKGVVDEARSIHSSHTTDMMSGEPLQHSPGHDDVLGTDQGTPAFDSTTAYSPLPPPSKEHHHHVPQNAFLSIGLQTSLAIALHKLPEGFITYATNHTNPTLGWSVFIALFIHNITEGFAMALPLYLALKSRLKAVVWSSLLGGVSQPAGAGLAALWVWGARRANGPVPGDIEDPNGASWAVYGGMFAATAGVMTNVSLQLFSEGLVLSHNQNLCIGFAIAGMGILGLSFALTA